MKEFDIKSASFVGAIFIICLIFAGLVANAYKYLPAEPSAKQESAKPVLKENVVSEDIEVTEDDVVDNDEEAEVEDEAEEIETNEKIILFQRDVPFEEIAVEDIEK